MLMHLRAQLARSKPPPTTAAQPKAPPGRPEKKTSPTLDAVIAELRAEISALRREVAALQAQHEASHIPSISPRTAPTVVPPQPPSPSTASSISIAQEGVAHPGHHWLQPILDHAQCPPFIKHIDSSMVPTYSFDLPEETQQVLQIIYSADMPRFAGFDSNGNLFVAIRSSPELVVAAIVVPPGAPFPPAPSLNAPF